VKRQVVDVLRRGIDNTLANWQLILVRLGETLLFGVIAVAGAIAIIVPILVSVGIEMSKLRSPEDIATAAAALLTKWYLLGWVLLAVLVLLTIFVAIHAFVEAGCVRVYVDAERIAGPLMEGPRTRFAVFSMERWYAGGVDGWWTLFWIYNGAGSVAALILLIPLVPTALLMLVFREEQTALIATGCVGLALTAMLLLFVGTVTAMWTTRSVTGWAVRRAGAADALRAGWRAFRADVGRHLLVALAIFVVAMAGSSVFGSFSMFAALGEIAGRHGSLSPLFTAPLRIAGTLLNSAFSAVVSSWFLASYAALAAEK
jgi:hypothetical protein